jgi:hypothetical protein
MPWSRAFEDSIPLPGGGTLRTLRDAASYLMALPGKARQSNEWQSGDRGAIDGGGKPRPADACAHRYVESAQSARREGCLIPRAKTRIGESANWRRPGFVSCLLMPNGFSGTDGLFRVCPPLSQSTIFRAGVSDSLHREVFCSRKPLGS